MADETQTAPAKPRQHREAPEQTRVHRFMVGDHVEYTAELTNAHVAKVQGRRLSTEKDADGNPVSDPDAIVLTKLAGVVEALTNKEGTYLLVDFGVDGKRELTEDELHRTGAPE